MVFVIYNFYVIILQRMWKINKKGMKEAKKIFNHDIEEEDSKKAGYEYFQDNIEVEISKTNNDSINKSQRRKDRKARLENIENDLQI